MKRIVVGSMVVLAAIAAVVLTALADQPATPQNVQGAWIAEPDSATNYTRVNWDLVSGATGYNVFRYNSDSNLWELIAPSVPERFFRDYEPGTLPAYYSVSAVGPDGESAASSTVTAQIDDPVGYIIHYPGEWPNNSLTPTNALIWWETPWMSGVDGMLEFGPSLTNMAPVLFDSFYANGHGLHLTNLNPATLYYYRITSVGTNRAGLALIRTMTTLDTNHPPVAADVTLGEFQDDGVDVPLSCTDPDSVGQVMFTFRIVSAPTNGTVSPTVITTTVTQAGVVYIPNPGARGEDHFQYIVNDSQLDSAPATVTITNIFLNSWPEVASISTNMPEDTSLTMVLSATDADGDPVTIHVGDASYGSATFDGTNLTYTPPPDFNGEVTLHYYAEDPYSFGYDSPITITVTPVNDPPVAYPFPFVLETYEDSSYPLYFWGSDLEGDPLTFRIVNNPTNGTISETPPYMTYTPAPNFHGTDSFTFVADDGQATSAPVAVDIIVYSVNDWPEATPASVTLAEDTSTNIVLTGTDADGDPLSFEVVYPPAHGTLSGTPPNLVYTPDADYFGDDSFMFAANDGQITSDSAEVLITVTPVSDAPVATPASVTLAEDASANVVLSGTDVDGDTLTFAVVSSPAHGILSGTPPNLVYTPAANYFGGDSFTFTANDGQATSASATVTITVTAVNDAPVATPGSVTTAEDTSANVVLSGTDVEGSALTFAVVSGPAHGTLSGTAPNLVYTPAANFFGGDSFTFTANDGQATSASATVAITVTAVNDAPVATPGSITTAEDTSANIVLSGTDVEGSGLTFAVVSGPAHGTLSGTAPNLVYTPAANYFGGDSFTFTANDGQATSASATVTITVTAVNDAPVAQAQSVSTPYNTPLAITLAGTDVDGSALSYVVLSQPAHGTLTGTAPNLTFTPNIGFSGADSFTIKVNDGSLDSAAATVTITVQAATSVPSAPSGLTAAAVSSSQINLAWADNSNNEDGFKIERSTNGSTWTQIATVGPNAGTYASTGLSANKTYFYRVRAYNVLGNSGYSNTASAKTLH